MEVWGLGGQGLQTECEWGMMEGQCGTQELGCTNCRNEALSLFATEWRVKNMCPNEDVNKIVIIWQRRIQSLK